jgi:outer membrane protein assembly factor BamB
VRRFIVVSLAILSVLAAVQLVASVVGGHGARRRRATSTTASSAPATAGTPARLAPGSDPSALPGPLLVADRGNDRLLVVDPQGRVQWEFPRPGDLAAGQTFKVPDDAFFTPDGSQIIATQEDDFVISLIDVATHRIVWRYGTPGIHGSGPNQVWNPDDAILLPTGQVLTADIKNCRLLLIAPGEHQPQRVYGRTTAACRHAPPSRWGSPNGAFPMTNGHYLVTEINGNWVDEMDLAGRVYFSTHPPGVLYPSDTNEVRPGQYLTVDYSNPGQIETFNRSGLLLWRYRPTGAGALRKPSLAMPLENGDVLCNDDFNHRVIVVDPRTNRVVWQYGVTGMPGRGPGMLRIPDGVDLVPPNSLLVRHGPTMGQP